jgi:hypothetical protein
MVSLEDLAVHARITFNACLMYRMGWCGLDWINLAEDSDKCLVVDTAVSFRVS